MNYPKDERFRYVKWSELKGPDREKARKRYPDYINSIPFEEWFYPVNQDGTLARSNRWIPEERAHEIRSLDKVRRVMEE
jgi:hypothetical protein